jgi:hypothetical protein
MVIGAAGELPKPPSKPIVFLEGLLVLLLSHAVHNVFYQDMDDAELAEAVISEIVRLNKPYLTSSIHSSQNPSVFASMSLFYPHINPHSSDHYISAWATPAI